MARGGIQQRARRGRQRLDRRKARTRQALIDAAVRAADGRGRGDRASSLPEITEEADIGFGSFYNPFDSKEQLPDRLGGVLERWGQLIDRAAPAPDPAKLFAVGTRITGGWAGPTRRSPGSSPAPAWTSWTSPSAWRREPCATSRLGRPRAASLFPMPRSRSAPRPADARTLPDVPAAPGSRHRDHRRPGRRGRAAMLGVPADQAARLAALPSRDTARGNTRDDAADRVPRQQRRSPQAGIAGRGLPGAESYRGLDLMPASRRPCSHPAINPSQRPRSRYGWQPADPPRRPVLSSTRGRVSARRTRPGRRARIYRFKAMVLSHRHQEAGPRTWPPSTAPAASPL